MQYHCVQCNEVFTLDPSEDKPRCPKCLRQHGLRPVEAVLPSRSTRSLAAPIAIVAVLALGAGGYAYYHQTHKHSPERIPLAPLDADTVRDDVRALAASEAGPLAQLLESDAKVTAFAQGAVKGAASSDKKAQAIVAALQARKRQQAFVIWPRSDPREGPPLTASAALTAIERDGARREMYPLELSALAVAALRSVAVPALVAEVYRYPDEKTALDPSGRLGYHAVFVPSASGDRGKLYDAYGGRSAQPQAGDYVVLNDVQAVGAAFALRAMQRLDNLADSKAGLADSEVAIKLVPSSASVRSVRAALLLATGGVEAGTHELDAAAQLRSDAARHNNLAVLALASSGPDRAAKEVASALSEAPDYALARITLASVHLMRAERDLARSELEQAERLEPNLVQLPQVWAQFYASSSDFTRAVAKGEEAVQRRPKDLQAHLVLAQVYRAASRYSDMRKQAHEIVRLAGRDDKERIQSVVRALLGPTALEDTAQPDPAPERQDSPQALGGPGVDNPTAASDLGQAAEPGALQLHPGASRLRLGGAGSQLKLNLKP